MKEILTQLRELILKHNHDFVPTRWQDRESALEELDQFLALEEYSPAHLEHLKLLFAPTGSLQELSIIGGWAEEYLRLAAEMDRIFQSK